MGALLVLKDTTSNYLATRDTSLSGDNHHGFLRTTSALPKLTTLPRSRSKKLRRDPGPIRPDNTRISDIRSSTTRAAAPAYLSRSTICPPVASFLGPSPQTVLLRLRPKLSGTAQAALPTCSRHHLRPALTRPPEQAKAVASSISAERCENLRSLRPLSHRATESAPGFVPRPPPDTAAPAPSHGSVTPPDAGFPAPGHPPSPARTGSHIEPCDLVLHAIFQFGGGTSNGR